MLSNQMVSLSSKASYVTSKEASKKAINRILGDTLNGEEPEKFNDIVHEEKARANEATKRIKLMGKEDEWSIAGED